jgi:hypothetical protein
VPQRVSTTCFRSQVGQVPLEPLDIRAELSDCTLGRTVVELHVGNRGQVDLGAIELADCRPEDLPLLVGRPLFGELKDGVAHDSTLGGPLLEARLGPPAAAMDFVWIQSLID